MQTQNNPFTIYDRGWIVRIQPPETPGPHRVMLLLHGWTGDETVMWVFTRSLPKDFWLIAPRAPVPTGTTLGGYGWVKDRPGSAREFDAYAAAAPGLLASVQSWLNERGVTEQPIHLMGFSQGAAMAYTLLINHTDKIGQTAGLAGLIPHGAEKSLQPGQLMRKRVFIAHGTKDETVPVRMARTAAELLDHAGADVTYSEDESGHKLGSACHKSLASFFM